MDIYSSFIVYLVLYRLAIVAAGILSIYWGYRLFIQLAIIKMAQGESETAKKTTEKGTDANISIGKDVNLSLKNAAPGSVFALFGAAIIIAMIWNGGPSLTIDNMEKAAEVQKKVEMDTKTPRVPVQSDSTKTYNKAPEKTSNKTKSATPKEASKLSQQQQKAVEQMIAKNQVAYERRSSVTMRGDDLSAEQLKTIKKLISTNGLSKKDWTQYSNILSQKLNGDAWALYKKKDYSHAKFNVDAALRFAPKYWQAWDTKADILFADNKTSEARGALEKAIVYAPSANKKALESKLAGW